MYPVMKVCESVGRRAKPAVRPQKFATQINTRDLMKLNKYWRVVQWVKSLGETPMSFSHLAYAYLRESVRTRYMGQDESHSHP